MSIVTHKNLGEAWSLFVVDECEESFYKIYEHYNHYLAYVAIKRGFSFEKAQDVINDVFMYLWENRTRASQIVRFNNYIITIFLRRLVKQDIVSFDELPEDDAHVLDPALPSVEEVFMQRQAEESVSQLLHDMIRQLGDKQQKLVYQKFYLGLSYGEIALANDVSINTVYNTIYKSVNKLRGLLSAEQETFLKIAIGALSTYFLIFL